MSTADDFVREYNDDRETVIYRFKRISMVGYNRDELVRGYQTGLLARKEIEQVIDGVWEKGVVNIWTMAGPYMNSP